MAVLICNFYRTWDIHNSTKFQGSILSQLNFMEASRKQAPPHLTLSRKPTQHRVYSDLDIKNVRTSMESELPSVIFHSDLKSENDKTSIDLHIFFLTEGKTKQVINFVLFQNQKLRYGVTIYLLTICYCLSQFTVTCAVIPCHDSNTITMTNGAACSIEF